jgi:hypothetical protein
VGSPRRRCTRRRLGGSNPPDPYCRAIVPAAGRALATSTPVCVGQHHAKLRHAPAAPRRLGDAPRRTYQHWLDMAEVGRGLARTAQVRKQVRAADLDLVHGGFGVVLDRRVADGKDVRHGDGPLGRGIGAGKATLRLRPRQAIRPARCISRATRATRSSCCPSARRWPDRLLASAWMPASVSRRVSRPCASHCRVTKPAASRSSSMPSWQGQPADRHKSFRRLRWLAPRGQPASPRPFDDLHTLPEGHAALDFRRSFLGSG